MHIIVLENEPSSQRGGQERSLLDVCQGLAQRGHQLTLLYVRPGDLLSQYQSFCADWHTVAGYRFYPHRPLQSMLQMGRDIFKIPVTRDSLVYSNQYHDSVFGTAFARLRRVPFVCHLRVPPGLPLGLQWNWGMAGTHQLIAVSRQTQADWQAAGFGQKPIDVVYNAIDVDRFQPTTDLAACRQRWGLAPGDRAIAYVGRLDRVKGVETLLRAFAQMKLTQTSAPHTGGAAPPSQIHLLIAGKPLIANSDYGKQLERLATKLGIGTQVHFLGHVSDPRLVYQASDLVVLPSEWSEPFGRVLIESMACAVPAIGSAIGGIPEVLTNLPYKALFTAGDLSELATRLTDLINWRSEHPELGDQCRQYVKANFLLSNTIDGVETALRKALHR